MPTPEPPSSSSNPRKSVPAVSTPPAFHMITEDCQAQPLYQQLSTGGTVGVVVSVSGDIADVDILEARLTGYGPGPLQGMDGRGRKAGELVAGEEPGEMEWHFGMTGQTADLVL